MKPLAVALGLLFAASLPAAETTTTTTATTTTATTTATTATAATATTSDKAAKPADAKAAPATKEVKKVEVLPKIPGTEIARPNGTFLGLEVAGGNFKLTFYSAKKKPMAIDVTRAVAHWPNPRKIGDDRTVLNGSGTSLVGAKPVMPPYTFNVYLTLLQGDGDDAKAVESYVVAFRG